MVSVIIPVYNRENVIERSIKSVLDQTYKDLECIVIDDGSNDGTESVVRSINDNRLIYFKLDTNSGACVARNKGIDLARGEYIAFQDSDDVWHPNKIELQLWALNNNPEAEICFCRKHIISVSEKYSYDTLLNDKEGIVQNKKLYETSRVSTQTILATRHVFEHIKFDEKVKKGQDYEWTLRASEFYKFYFVAHSLVDQYLQKDSITVKGAENSSLTVEMNQYFYEKFQDKYSENPDLQIALLNRILSGKLACGGDLTKDYIKLFSLTHSMTTLLKLITYKLGINKLKQKIKRKDFNKSLR